MQNLDFEVVPNQLKIGQLVAYERRSLVRGNVLHIKTAMGLGRFEVGKTRNSYDVPFRSYSIVCEKKIEASLLADEGRTLWSETLAQLRRPF